MASKHEVSSLFIILLSLSSALLSGDAIPQGYHERHRRSHKCQTCPRDCSEKLTGDGQVPIAQYTPQQAAQTQYAAAVEASYTHPHPTPAPYVTAAAQPQVQQYSAAPGQSYERIAPPVQAYQQLSSLPRGYQQVNPQVQAYRAPPSPYVNNYNREYNAYPYNEPADNYLDPYGIPGYDCPYDSCRCGRSLDTDDRYAVYSKYNRRSLGQEKSDEPPVKPLPFADESSPPADFYKNYRPYVRDYDRSDDDSEEEASRGNPNKERLFVVYRADAFDDKPSDSELESVIRQAMDVARQQKNQENYARNGRKPDRYHYATQEKRHHNNHRIEFQPLNGKSQGQRFNLSPGPLMNVDETYVKEEGDDALNPGLDQSKWTAVPAVTDLELKSAQTEAADEIEAAVSVVPEISKTKIMKVPKIVQKSVDATVVKDKLKKDSIEILRAEEIEKKNEKMTELIEDMPTPSTVTESAKFEKPAEIIMTSAPTTDVTTQ